MATGSGVFARRVDDQAKVGSGRYRRENKTRQAVGRKNLAVGRQALHGRGRTGLRVISLYENLTGMFKPYRATTRSTSGCIHGFSLGPIQISDMSS